MFSHVILSETYNHKWFARLVTQDGSTFQFLEVYDSEPGKLYWLTRLKSLGLPVTIEVYKHK